MSAYRLSSPYERPPLRRRASGLALALGVNAGLVLLLLTIGSFAPEAKKDSTALVVDLIPESHSVRSPARTAAAAPKSAAAEARPQRTPPPVLLPSKPTIAVPPPTPQPPTVSPIVPMSAQDLAAADIGSIAKSGSGSAGDSDIVGRGPHGEVLYAAAWARHPTSAELGGYVPRNAEDGFGTVACKTIPGDRVEDCVELDQTPGSHLASAVRQAAWQFRVRPPRRNGVPLVGSWVSIRIDYTFAGRDEHL